MKTLVDDLYQAAAMYYLQGETMDAIADHFQVSRSTISRMLRDARTSGMVKISVQRPVNHGSTLTKLMHRTFGVQCQLVEIRHSVSEVARLNRVAQVAASVISDLVSAHDVVGVAWGTTLSAITANLPRHPKSGVTVVQLNGAANPATTGIPYAGVILASFAEAFDAEVVHFPVPAFFDFEQTKAAMWRESSIRRVLDLHNQCTVAVFGVGSLSGTVLSHVYAGGYLSTTDREELTRERVVGDVCTVLLREDGTWADIPLNARASGPTPPALFRIPRRICVAAGTFRALPLLGALRAGVITDLVVDEPTAVAVLERAGVAPARLRQAVRRG